MYFLCAPLCLLAVCGLRGLLAAARRPGLRRAAGVLAAAALAGMAVDVVRLHPHQDAYFNFLVDRSTPERLRTQYGMLHSGAERREGLEYLLARYPDETMVVDGVGLDSGAILPAAARNRIVFDSNEADFSSDTLQAAGISSPRWGFSTRIAFTATPCSRSRRSISPGSARRPLLPPAPRTAPRRPASRCSGPAAFDLHLDGRTLTWVSAACSRRTPCRRSCWRSFPPDPDDLPRLRRERGWLGRSFRFGRFGVRFDGRCLARRILPDFPVRALRVGRWLRDEAGVRRREATTVDLSARDAGDTSIRIREDSDPAVPSALQWASVSGRGSVW